MRRFALPLILLLAACGADADGDGVRAGADCDDDNAAVYPEAEEICDGFDNDCDGEVDEGVTSTFHADIDGDGYGDPEVSFERCEAGDGEVADATDCDDSEGDAFPGNDESCDGIDNDCDEEVDEPDAVDAITWYRDTDGDDFGDDEDTVVSCDPGAGWSAAGGDCDETNDEINPGADEYCDEVDNDCDGDIDEADALDAPTWYLDNDEDTYGDPDTSVAACAAPEGYVADSTDCDDRDRREFPGVMWWPDADNDTFGDATAEPSACEKVEVNDKTNDGDCDDSDPEINPDADEVWYDGVDQNCDGLSDFDFDGDGYDSAEESETGDDCDDTNPMINPGGTESQDQVDNDCDGLCDEGFIGVGDLIITEIMQNPSAVSDSDGEWFEVYNTTSTDITMCGWVLADDDSDSHSLTEDVTITAGGYAVFGNNDDTATNGGVTVDYSYGSSWFLSNSADEVVLFFDSTEIDRVDYDGGPNFPDPSGASMNLDPDFYDETDNDVGSNWCEPTSTYGDGDAGTPGDANDECP